MINRAKEIVLDNWREWFSDPTPRRPAFVKLAGNSLADGRVILILFTERGGSPRLIIKIPRSPNQVEATRQEYSALTRLHQLVSNDLATTLPRPLHYEPLDDICLYIESAVVGKLMGNMRSPWHVGDGYRTRRKTTQNVTRALEWLADFHQQTASNHQRVDRVTIDKWADSSIYGLYPKDATPEHIDRALQVAIERLTELLEGQTLPLSCEHGDFWAGNVFVTKQGLGVIDWSDASFDRLPLFDAFFFVNSYALGFAPQSDDPLWMLKELLHSRSWFSELVESALTCYAESIGLDPQASLYLIGIAAGRKAFREMTRTETETRHGRLLDLWARRILDGL